MKNISSEQLRKERTLFWESKTHKYLPESSLIADKESTALFNVAGMQQIIPYLMGKPHELGKRLFNIQKCVRTVDIDEVGDMSHLTFFEMMGNRSLGDYFKKESVSRSREFLTKYLEFDPKKLAVTVFAGDENAPKDEETAGYWKEIGLPTQRISYLPAKHNWRSPGPVGPCGPDTEIFFRVGNSEFPPEGSNVENDEDNWMEIWNNVFMEYYRDEQGVLTKLKQQNVDTGMGFERMCTVLQQKESIYDTDLFMKSIQCIEKWTDLSYSQNKRRFRIIADHTRTAFMLINDGLIPSNVAAGYVLRMIIRRMSYNLMLLKELDQTQIASFLEDMLLTFEGLRSFQNETILRIINEEIKQFQKTISNGMKLLSSLIEARQIEKIIAGKDAFQLYDTYGFPLELTKEITKERGLQIDESGFHQALEESREKSKQATKDMFKKGIDRSKYLDEIPETTFVGYDTLETTSPKLLKEIDIEETKVLIFDISPFYAEMGGQAGDQGTITLDDGRIFEVYNVQKFAGVFLHFVR